MLLFTKPHCHKCEYVKEYIPAALKEKMKFYDATSEEGQKLLTEMDLLDLVNTSMPILIDDEGNVYDGAIECRKYLETLN
ncbi:MAG: hypothetical protein PHU71_04065 [Candidatus Gracilibacteria bacterium]|nr:hypothetical protein [Candidatus Gracilibacteria bacterium]